MYGPSGDFRYGFGPSGQKEYYEFYENILCTTIPMEYQDKLTIIASGEKPTLMEATNKARELLAQGKTAEAQEVLNEAINKIQGGR